MLQLFIILVLVLAFDSLYIGLQMSYFTKLYKTIQGKPLKIKPFGAIMCYIIIVFLINYMISHKKSSLESFVLGICVYGIYDSTSYALLADYPLQLLFTDTLWGGILFGGVTYIYKLIFID